MQLLSGPACILVREVWLSIAVALLVINLPSQSADTLASQDSSREFSLSESTEEDPGNDWRDYESSSSSDSDEYGASIGTRNECQGYTCSYRSSCGRAPLNRIASSRSTATAEPLIVNGNDQIQGEWPSFVVLVTVWQNLGRALCGGVLVSDRHILTAAHCVHNRFGRDKLNHIYVGLGVHNMTQFIDRVDASRPTRISSVYVSEGYRSGDLFEKEAHDWAVIELRDRARFNNYIQPACLPYGYTKGRRYRNCYQIGAGASSTIKEDGEYDDKEIIQKMPVRQTSCEPVADIQAYETPTRACYTKDGSPPGTSCGGDSGSPILCIDPAINRWVVIATVSMGHPSCGDIWKWTVASSRITTLLPTIKAESGI